MNPDIFQDVALYCQCCSHSQRFWRKILLPSLE